MDKKGAWTMNHIRKAVQSDAARLAEIEIFNYRLNFYPIFRSDEFYFGDLQVPSLMRAYEDPALLNNTFVYDDGVVKAMGGELEKLFVEPVLQGEGIGAALLQYAVQELGARTLWALEKNTRAIAFYQRHGFARTGEKKLEEDTEEYLIKLSR